MALRFVSFGILLTLASPWADAQELNPRYVPVPFQGDFEALFKQRLQNAKENAPLDNLLRRSGTIQRSSDLMRTFSKKSTWAIPPFKK